MSEIEAAEEFIARIDQDLIDDSIWLMRHDTALARSGQLPTVEIQDQDDLSILSAAISAGADVFVTGDKELLVLRQIENLAILSPRQFWEKLKAQPQRGTGVGKLPRSRWRLDPVQDADLPAHQF